MGFPYNFSLMKNAPKYGLLLLILLGFSMPSLAVIIAGGNGAANTTAPADDPGWGNVGSIRAGNPGKAGSRAGAVYLGDKWFITGDHVYELDGPTGVVVGAVSYTVDSNSWTRLQNTKNPYKGSDADLILFQVEERPSLPSLRIRSSAISSGANVTMIGNGYDRQSNMVYWDASWDLTDEISGVYSGYLWNTSSKILRWGTNQVSSVNSWITTAYGSVRSFKTTFDGVAGGNECQASLYDSGGGVFYKNGMDWELAGIMLYVDQPAGGAAVYGTDAYMADISDFYAQITNQIVNFDSDIDGLPDWWESEHTNSATAMSASADSDGDGFTNLEEWYSDSNPTNDTLFFDNTGTLTLTNQTFSFTGSTNRQYQVFYTTNDLADAGLTWTAHSSPIWGSGAGTEIIVTNTEDTVFYRIWVTLP